MDSFNLTYDDILAIGHWSSKRDVLYDARPGGAVKCAKQYATLIIKWLPLSRGSLNSPVACS